MFNLAINVFNNIKPLRFISSFEYTKCLSKNNEVHLTVLRNFQTFPEPLNNTNEKILQVAIIGAPNSGKSTLINNLMDRKVCATSNKIHTTKKLTRAIFNKYNTQIIFLDTPGIVTPKEQKKYSLRQDMVHAPKASIKHADVVGVIHDSAHPWTRESLNPLIIDILKKHEDIPSFLILNKIDLMKSKRKLLDSIRVLCNNMVAGKPISKLTKQKESKVERGFSGFSDVFIVSALEGDGVEKIKGYLVNCAKPGKWLYPKADWTDQKQETLIVEAIRAKLLDFLHQEIPYKLVTEMEFFEEKANGTIVCLVVVTCPTERIEKLIAGAGGGKLRQITDFARQDLVDMFHRPVNLTISLRTETKPIEDN